MKYFRTILVIVALAALGCTYAQSNNNDKTCTSQKCAAADPVMLQLDSMSGSLFTRDKLFVNDEQLQASIDLPYNMIPKYSDDEMKEKMRLIPSIIPLNYNENVKQFIEDLCPNSIMLQDFNGNFIFQIVITWSCNV